MAPPQTAAIGDGEGSSRRQDIVPRETHREDRERESLLDVEQRKQEHTMWRSSTSPRVTGAPPWSQARGATQVCPPGEDYKPS